jgi:hypothetical protein
MKHLIRLLTIAAAAVAVSAYATPTMTIFDGTNTVTIMDGGANDSCPDAGCVTWIGSLGVWNINVDTGLTKPATGTPTHLDMDLSFVAHSRAAGMLTVTWSDDGYMMMGGATNEIGGTTQGTVSNNILLNGGPIASLAQGPFSGGAFSGTTNGSLSLSPADLISLQVKITHTGIATTTGDNHLTVPEGGSALALLGMGLLGLEGLRRRMRPRQS